MRPTDPFRGKRSVPGCASNTTSRRSIDEAEEGTAESSESPAVTATAQELSAIASRPATAASDASVAPEKRWSGPSAVASGTGRARELEVTGAGSILSAIVTSGSAGVPTGAGVMVP
jgi:hypothetical protein